MDNLRLYIDNLNEGNKTLFRRLEKLNYKLIEATHSIRFNKNCLREKLCPRGIQILENELQSNNELDMRSVVDEWMSPIANCEL